MFRKLAMTLAIVAIGLAPRISDTAQAHGFGGGGFHGGGFGGRGFGGGFGRGFGGGFGRGFHGGFGRGFYGGYGPYGGYGGFYPGTTGMPITLTVITVTETGSTTR